MKIFFVLIFLMVLLIGYFAVDRYGPLERPKDLAISEQNISDQKIPKPENFIQIKRDIQKGVFYALENLSEEYYMQPDFYPSNEYNNSVHDYTRWGVHGYGTYPGEISYNVKNFNKDQYVNVYTFVKASDNIETFQGVKFDFDVLHQNIKNQSENKSDQNNSQLFDIYINPDTIMFSPTFPERSEYAVESRTYKWVYKLKITIAAKTDIPPGIYEFRLKALPPGDDVQRSYYEDIQKINQKWYKCPENNKDIKCDDDIVELRKKVYVNGGQFQADKFFNIIINVNK